METKSTHPVPGSASTFAPLPGGTPALRETPERIRQQLGWGLRQSGGR